MDDLFATYSAALPVVAGWVEEAYPAAEGEPPPRAPGRSRPRRSTCCAGCCPPPRSPTGDLRHRPDLRAADPAPARPPAARGPRVRADDPRGGPGRDAQLRRAGRAARPGRRVDRVPRAPRGGRPAVGGPARARPGRRGPRSRTAAPRSACCTSTGPRRTCSPRSCSRRRASRRRRPGSASRSSTATSERRSCTTSSASGATAATAPAAGSRRCATASRSSRLRRLPRPPAPPDADRPVAAPHPRPRRRCPRGGRPRRRGDDYRRALERSRAEHERLTDAGLPLEATYALCLGYRIRYVLDLNAREAMQLIELRSGREGHPSYRAVAHEMHAQIAAVHPAVAAAMIHVDRETEPRLERILSEMRNQAKRDALTARARRPTSCRACSASVRGGAGRLGAAAAPSRRAQQRAAERHASAEARHRDRARRRAGRRTRPPGRCPLVWAASGTIPTASRIVHQRRTTKPKAKLTPPPRAGRRPAGREVGPGRSATRRAGRA